MDILEATQSGSHTVGTANTPEPISNDVKLKFNKLWLYPSKGAAQNGDNSGVTPGQLIPNAGNVFVGEKTASGTVTPDKLANTDLPMLIELPVGKQKLLRDVYIQAPVVGDGVWFKFWP